MADRKRTSRRGNRQRKRSKSAITGNPNSYKHLYQDGTGQTIAPSQEPVAVASTSKGSETVDWQSDYGYVIRDLRILFIVSALIFVVMIGAGFLF